VTLSEVALEVKSVAAEAEVANRRNQVRDDLSRDLKAARHAADRAFRQCDAIDPANPLAAAELELRWNNALGRVAELETRIADHVAVTPPRSETVLARKGGNPVQLVDAISGLALRNASSIYCNRATSDKSPDARKREVLLRAWRPLLAPCHSSNPV